MQMREKSSLCPYNENKHRTRVSFCTEKINEVLRENTDDIDKLSDAITTAIVKTANASQGAFYLVESINNKLQIRLHGSYGVSAEIKMLFSPEKDSSDKLSKTGSTFI